MKIAVITSLLTKWNVDINTCHWNICQFFVPGAGVWSYSCSFPEPHRYNGATKIQSCCHATSRKAPISPAWYTEPWKLRFHLCSTGSQIFCTKIKGRRLSVCQPWYTFTRHTILFFVNLYKGNRWFRVWQHGNNQKSLLPTDDYKIHSHRFRHLHSDGQKWIDPYLNHGYPFAAVEFNIHQF